MAYADLLRHPKWQRKRLEILDRAGMQCEWCDDKETELHIHHSYYERGLKPWEYPDESLTCLCKHCHEDAESGRLALLKESGNCDLRMLLGVVRGMQSPFGIIECDDYEVAWGVGLAWGLHAEDVIPLIRDGEVLERDLALKVREVYGEKIPRHILARVRGAERETKAS